MDGRMSDTKEKGDEVVFLSTAESTRNAQGLRTLEVENISQLPSA